MARDGTATRERLLDAAERVFAEQGIDHASLADIHRLAGQANKSALHYHFGSRDQLLDTVLARHTQRVRPLRRAMVERLRAAPSPPTLAELLTAVIQPLADQMHTASGRDCIRVVSHLRTRDGGFRRNGALVPQAGDDLHWLYARLGESVGHLPERLRVERLAAWNDMSAGTLADWATTAETEGEHAMFTVDELVVNLVDMGVAALSAPSRLGTPARPVASSGRAARGTRRR